jgi:hypothetical protein
MCKNIAAIFLGILFFSTIALSAALIPDWLYKRIQEEKIQGVETYSYKDKQVYYLLADCCDRFNEVLNENGDFICAPTGGISGKGNYQCPDFLSEAQAKRVIYKAQK